MNQFDFVYVTGCSGFVMFRKNISLFVFFIKAHIYFATPLPQNEEFSEYGEPPTLDPRICILPKELDYNGNNDKLTCLIFLQMNALSFYKSKIILDRYKRIGHS